MQKFWCVYFSSFFFSERRGMAPWAVMSLRGELTACGQVDCSHFCYQFLGITGLGDPVLPVPLCASQPPFKNKQTNKQTVGEMAQQLGALAALPEVPGSIPSTPMAAHNCLWLLFQEVQHPYNRHTYRQDIDVCKIKIDICLSNKQTNKPRRDNQSSPWSLNQPLQH